ncbi:type IV pilus assembly protein PilM [Candidatus Saccharibacteria bacterium]|nr:type IV pilus assembly protein PilM [Candidatus Saccharibacteria bacterium]
MEFPLIYTKQALFGLDIGQHSAKFMQLRRANKRLSIIGFGSTLHHNGAVIEGVIAEPDVLAESLRVGLRHPAYGKITAQAAVAGLPQAHLFTRILTLPAMEHDKLAEAVQWESQQYIPMPMNDLYLDFEIINVHKDENGQEKQYDILMVAAPRAIIDSYMHLFELLKITPHGLETTLAANIRALRPHNPPDTVLIIDAGSTATDMAVVADTIRVTTSVPVGGELLIKILVQKLKITRDQAEEIVVRFGIADSGLQKKVVNATANQLQIIVTEATKLLKYYTERSQTNQQTKISRILLSGGVAQMPGLADYISKATRLRVEVASPWGQHLITLPQSLPVNVATKFTTVFGLALREFQDA